MNTCFESHSPESHFPEPHFPEPHFPEHVLESYAMGKAPSLDYGPLEEHLLLCEACRQRLMKVEEFILVIRAALAEMEVHPHARFGPQPAFAL
jgi:predicted anti-sigma-YlaC factor YlaD